MISLTEIKFLIDSLLEKDNEVEKIEGDLKKAKEESRRLREEIIPCALQELGLTKLVLDTGETITLSQDVYASIPQEKKQKAFSWLTEMGFSGLIKIDVITSFSKGQYHQAKDFHDKLYAKGIASKLSQTVHPQTLKAFLKEQMAKGADVPLDFFGATSVFKTKIKR
jgi:hypothetical protein